jgi:hypothetical protein
MSNRLRWVAVLGCAAVVGLACGRVDSPAAAPQNIPTSCGSGIQVPPDVLAVPDALPPITNRSTVAPRVASAWARGVVRALRVEAWALANSRDDLLMSGCLGDQRSQAQLFGDEIYLIGMAKQAHAVIVVTSPDVTALTLIELSPEKQAAITSDQQVASRYAWLVTTRGPSAVLLTAPGGKPKVVVAMPDGERTRDFYGGSYVGDSWAGPMWFQQSYFGCVSIKGRPLCA